MDEFIDGPMGGCKSKLLDGWMDAWIYLSTWNVIIYPSIHL